MSEKVVLEHDDLRRTLRRIAHEIAEKTPEPARLAVVGIHTRGAVLARRLHTFLGELTGTDLPIGDIDISFYRDDVGASGHRLSVSGPPARAHPPVLVARGPRELPFRPDYVGKNLPTSREERVNVRLEETDGIDQVTISEPQTAEAL